MVFPKSTRVWIGEDKPSAFFSIADHLSIDIPSILSSIPMQQWLQRIRNSNIVVQEVRIEAVTQFDGNIKHIFAQCLLNDPHGCQISRNIFLRGPSVCMLVKLVVDDGECGLVVSQTRIASGREIYEIPAGTVEDELPIDTACRELEEETGLCANHKDLIDMLKVLNMKSVPMSPGATFEEMHFFFLERMITEKEAQKFYGMEKGLEEEHEYIRVHCVPWKEMWTYCAYDAKSLLALSFYERMKVQGIIF